MQIKCNGETISSTFWEDVTGKPTMPTDMNLSTKTDVYTKDEIDNIFADITRRLTTLENGAGSIQKNTAPSISLNYLTINALESDHISIPYSIKDAEDTTFTAIYTKDGLSNTVIISLGNNTWNVGTLSVGNHTLSIQVIDSRNLISNTLGFNFAISNSNITYAIVGSAVVGTAKIA